MEQKLALRYLGSHEALRASSFPLHPHAAFVNLSVTPSCSCHQCLVPFPTARQVLCPSYPYMFPSLQICARQSSCIFVVKVPCFRMALLATSSGGQAAESMAERFVWPVGMTEIAFWETPPVNLLNLIPGYRECIGLGPVAGKSPKLC